MAAESCSPRLRAAVDAFWAVAYSEALARWPKIAWFAPIHERTLKVIVQKAIIAALYAVESADAYVESTLRERTPMATYESRDD